MFDLGVTSKPPDGRTERGAINLVFPIAPHRWGQVCHDWRSEHGDTEGEPIAKRNKNTPETQDALDYAENIIATLREPFMVLDKSLRVHTANTAFYRHFHASREETEGRLVYELGNGQWDVTQLRTLLTQVLSNAHAVEDFEVEQTFPVIGLRNMLLNARSFPPECNTPELILLAIEDNTDHKRAEAAMKNSEIRYRRLFETAKDGILILDALTGKVIDANPFMTDLLGYSHEEFLGKELWQIGLFRDIQESRSAYRELQQKGCLRYEDLPLKSTSGDKVEVEFVSNVYAEDHHQVVQCNIRDITERSRLQRRTQEQAAALAEMDCRKDEFLAMLGHELRNPLAPIPNALQVLEEYSPADPNLKRARDVIERQVKYMTRLVDDLLDVSRINRGKIILQNERVKLAQVVADAVEITRPHIEARKHTLTELQPPGPIVVEGDSTRLTQVLSNLLNNAAKYSERGSQIWLTVEKDEQEAKLSVRDTGIGIAPEMLPQVFDLFTQADRSLDRSQGGLGIGLALVRHLVAMHGGSIYARSDGLGKGSEFVIRLPVLSQISDSEEPTAKSSTSPIATRSWRILIADDNTDFAEMVAELLQRKWGHAVKVAYDGPAALKVAQTFRPDAVFLDIGLPGINGYELVKLLRKLPGCEKVMTVAITGYGQEEDRRRALSAGFDEHLTKPVGTHVLQKLLAERLGAI